MSKQKSNTNTKPGKPARRTKITKIAAGAKAVSQAQNKKPAPRKPEPGEASTGNESKQDKLIAMLRQADGATVAEMASALQWQAHSVRGVISGALKKKLGLAVTSGKVAGRGRVYRIADRG